METVNFVICYLDCLVWDRFYSVCFANCACLIVPLDHVGLESLGKVDFSTDGFSATTLLLLLLGLLFFTWPLFTKRAPRPSA